VIILLLRGKHVARATFVVIVCSFSSFIDRICNYWNTFILVVAHKKKLEKDLFNKVLFFSLLALWHSLEFVSFGVLEIKTIIAVNRKIKHSQPINQMSERSRESTLGGAKNMEL
jgi:hypothetical protein